MIKILLKSTIFLFFFVFISSSIVSAGTANNPREIDLALSPEDILFKIKNMKPGDWAPKNIIVKNSGQMDFEYSMKAENKGPKKLYNELILEIKDKKNTLYNGKLSEFTMLPKRFLKTNRSDELLITVRFPEHLGNDFQGLDVNFKLVFMAEGKEIPDGDPDDPENPGDPSNPDNPNNPGEPDNPESPDNPDTVDNPVDNNNDTPGGTIDNGDNDGGNQLPKTATNMFNFLFTGFYLLLLGVVVMYLSKRKRKSKFG